MKIFLFSLSLILSFSVHASELTKLIKPKALKETNWDKNFSKKEAESVLGKADLVEKNINYYSVKGIKYPLSIEYKKDKVTRVYAMMVDQKIFLKEMVPHLKTFKKNESSGQEQELYYYFESSDKKLKLKFSLIDHSLYSVERWY